jgi:hypothetical protein
LRLFAILALFCSLARPALAQSGTTAITNATSFASGGLEIGKGGKVTALAGYEGQVDGISDLHYHGAILALNGFVGAGSPATAGQITYGVGILPSITVGSLSFGVGAFEDMSNYSLHGMCSVSFSLK